MPRQFLMYCVTGRRGFGLDRAGMAETWLPHFFGALMRRAWGSQGGGDDSGTFSVRLPPALPHSLDHSIFDHLIRRIYLCGG